MPALHPAKGPFDLVQHAHHSLNRFGLDGTSVTEMHLPREAICWLRVEKQCVAAKSRENSERSVTRNFDTIHQSDEKKRFDKGRP